MGTSPISIEVLRETFLYKPNTGEFLNRRTGKVAGTINEDGYRVVKVVVDGRRVQIAVHKAAYAMHHGVYAKGEVDHRNTKRLDNRSRNLRDSTRAQNQANTRRRGKLPKGVAKSGRKSKPFKAQIKVAGKNITIGRFGCKKSAHAAYIAKAKEVHGAFARAS